MSSGGLCFDIVTIRTFRDCNCSRLRLMLPSNDRVCPWWTLKQVSNSCLPSWFVQTNQPSQFFGIVNLWMTCLNRHYSKPRVELYLSSVTNTLSFAHHLPQLMLYPLGPVVVKLSCETGLPGRLPLTWHPYQSKVLASYVRCPRSRDEVCSDWCIRRINSTIKMPTTNSRSVCTCSITHLQKPHTFWRPLVFLYSCLSRTVWLLISTNSGSLLQLAAIAQTVLSQMCLVFPIKCAPPTKSIRLQ